ncbi:glycosyltransferase family 4 protein [Reichenbachiella versicolor]|uniref:glycosyltransferase family 4 protein n=1 Tax=Reichenbachiella versicolor TaxID=1821036 RepID=UPI0013A5AB1F|nr:glycosyltransferase family 4 protein [Reichenbachiella versicolor]
MRIFYYHQFYNTPQEGGSLRSYYLSNYLSKKGHQVTVITSDISGQKRTNTINNVEIIYLPVKFDNSYRFWKRIWAYLKYALLAIWWSLRKNETESLNYVMTTPLSTGLIALFCKKFKNTDYIVEVGDLWPRVPIEMGYFKASWIQDLLYGFEKKFYQTAKGSVGLSPPITKHIRDIAPNVPIETIYNMADLDLFKMTAKKHLHQQTFTITYAGNFGIANDLCRMIPIIEDVQHLPIRFLFIGDGAEQSQMKNLAKGLSNCEFLGHLSKEGVCNQLTKSDAMLISFANYDSLFTGCPNKLFDAFAAKLIVITNFGGWTKDLIETEGVGFSFQHDSTKDFVNKISPFLKDQALLKNAKLKSELLGKERFSIPKQANLLTAFIENLGK